MMNIHLIRHGETNWNYESRVQGQSESELNDTGRSQAAALQDRVHELNPTAVYVSSAVRTRQTADLLTARIDVPMQHRDDLREIYLADWETRLWADVQAAEPEEVARFRTQPHQFALSGAENFLQLRQRGVSAIEDIISREQKGEILVVSHGAIIKALLLHYAGADVSSQWEGPDLYNCAHSILHVNEEGERHVVSVAGVNLQDIQW